MGADRTAYYSLFTTLELLHYCRARGLHIVLRPPHTTHVLQGEDVQHFAIFKPKYKYMQAKYTLTAARLLLLLGESRLTAGDLLLCAKEAWQEALNLEHSLEAWAKIGVSPFTRSVYWELKKAEDKHAAVAVAAQVNPQLLTIEDMVSVMFPIVARAQRRAQDGEEDGEQPRRKRRAESNLHSTDLWHLPGGATGDECYYEIVKEETLARRARESEAAQRKVARAEMRKSASASAIELGPPSAPTWSRTQT